MELFPIRPALACSVFYRAFPSQRLFDPRMVAALPLHLRGSDVVAQLPVGEAHDLVTVAEQGFAGEVDDLLARAFLPMPGDARTRPSYGRRTPRPRRCPGCTPSRSWTGPGRIGSSGPAIPAPVMTTAVAVRPRDARRYAAWRRPGPGFQLQAEGLHCQGKGCQCAQRQYRENHQESCR